MSEIKNNDNPKDESRRNLIKNAAYATAGVGAVCAILPFVDSMNPSKDVQALASVEVDISNIKVGEEKKVMWRGKPVFIKRRTSQEIEEAKNLPLSLLPKKTPTVEGLEINTYLKCASEVGGDYFDFLQDEAGTFYSICGDATGHGVTSGIMVAVTKAALNGIELEDPSTMMQKLNKIVRRIKKR